MYLRFQSRLGFSEGQDILVTLRQKAKRLELRPWSSASWKGPWNHASVSISADISQCIGSWYSNWWQGWYSPHPPWTMVLNPYALCAQVCRCSATKMQTMRERQKGKQTIWGGEGWRWVILAEKEEWREKSVRNREGRVNEGWEMGKQGLGRYMEKV